jgi:hypothetical protein
MTTNIHPVASTRMLDEYRDQVRVIETAINTPAIPLTMVRNREPGAYLHIYAGDIDCFKRAKRPGGRASTGSLAVDGGFPIYVGSAKSLANRTRRHVTNMIPVVDFDVRDFSVIVLPTATFAGARYVEELLIEAFGVPVLNGVVKGYGSQAQGTKRATQRMCEFNILFPGRRGCTGAANVTADELRNRVIIHLAQTVPDVCTTGVGPGQPMRNVVTSVRIGQHHAHRSIGRTTSRAAQQVIKDEHWLR